MEADSSATALIVFHKSSMTEIRKRMRRKYIVLKYMLLPYRKRSSGGAKLKVIYVCGLY